MKKQISNLIKSYFFCLLITLLLLLDKSEEIKKEEKPKYNISISFDLSDPNISIEPDDNGEIKPIENFTWEAYSSFKIPKVYLKRNSDRFQGWTADGIYGYEAGRTLRVEGEDIIFRPVFTEKNDTNFYKVEHLVEYNGTKIECKVAPFTKKKNSFVSMSPSIYSQPTANQEGWQTEGHRFITTDLMVMPAHDVVFTPVWHNLHYIIYHSADLPGVIGNRVSILTTWEGANYQLSDATRLTRSGYILKGWHCDYDDQDYDFYDYFNMPDEDIIFYAIWEPKNYRIAFNTGLTDIKSIYISGLVDTIITIPEIPHEKEGYTFGGFQSNGGAIYFPGDNFYIEGQLTGISFTAIWNKNN